VYVCMVCVCVCLSRPGATEGRETQREWRDQERQIPVEGRFGEEGGEEGMRLKEGGKDG